MTLEEKYYELLNAVSQKFANESRHGTALRYIRDADKQTVLVAASAEKIAEVFTQDKAGT